MINYRHFLFNLYFNKVQNERYQIDFFDHVLRDKSIDGHYPDDEVGFLTDLNAHKIIGNRAYARQKKNNTKYR